MKRWERWDTGLDGASGITSRGSGEYMMMHAKNLQGSAMSMTSQTTIKSIHSHQGMNLGIPTVDSTTRME